jgi:hypothetical protein
VRGEAAEEPALDRRFPHEAELPVLEIAQPSVHQLRRLARGSRREVEALDEPDAPDAQARDDASGATPAP